MQTSLIVLAYNIIAILEGADNEDTCILHQILDLRGSIVASSAV